MLSMNTFNDLILKHKGKIICVMGGAPTLEDDLKQIKADIYISTNGHGCDFIKPDYLFAMDDVNGHYKMPMGESLKALSDAPIISPKPYADYQLMSWPQAPRDVLSGMVAAWCAYLMGAKCVVLAGMNGYQDRGYIFESVKIAKDIYCPVRVMSDELVKVWPKYAKTERFGKYAPHSNISSWLGVDETITVEVVKPTTVRGSYREKGFRTQVMRHEVSRLLKHKMLKEV
jgi:hypothetical protein